LQNTFSYDDALSRPKIIDKNNSALLALHSLTLGTGSAYGARQFQAQLGITARAASCRRRWRRATGPSVLDHLWLVADQVMTRALGRPSTHSETTSYWQALVGSNSTTLADPNLLHPGERLTLPLWPGLVANRREHQEPASHRADEPAQRPATGHLGTARPTSRRQWPPKGDHLSPTRPGTGGTTRWSSAPWAGAPPTNGRSDTERGDR
jgi:hypothetical protein